MATRMIDTDGGASALPILLATIPSLPRPILSRLVARMIDQLDELDGDPDLEDSDEDESVEDDPEGFDPEEDCCLAGDDGIFSGAVRANGIVDHYVTGDDPDAEDDGAEQRALHRHFIQQTRCRPMMGTDWRGRAHVYGYALKREPTAPKLATWRRKHPSLRKRR